MDFLRFNVIEMNRIYRYLNHILFFFRVRIFLLFRGINIVRHEGFSSLKQRVDSLQSNNFIAHQVNFRGLPNSFFVKLLRICTLVERIREYCLNSNLLRNFYDFIVGHFSNEDVEAISYFKFKLRLNNKHTTLRLLNFVRSSCVISGWFLDTKSISASQIRLIFKGEAYYPTRGPSTDVLNQFPETKNYSYNNFGLYKIFYVPFGFNRIRLEVKDSNLAWVTVHRFFFIRLTNSKTFFENDFSYADWVKQEQTCLLAEGCEIERHIDVMITKPTFAIIVNEIHDTENKNAVIESIKNQIYPYWEMVRVNDQDNASQFLDFDRIHGSSILHKLDMRYEFIIILESGQCLAKNALYEFASVINMFPSVDIIFGDEDCIDAFGNRYDPFFKPNWSPEYLETFNFLGFPTCFRTDLAKKLSQHVCLNNFYDFVLRYTELTENVFHVNKILGHSRDTISFSSKEKVKAVQQDIKALSGRLSRTGRSGNITQHDSHLRCYTIRINLEVTPVISIIIRASGKAIVCGNQKIDLIKNVIGQIYKYSTYEQIEVIIVNNDNLSREQISYVSDTGCTRICSCDSMLDSAAIFNQGAALARGDLLLFMNDNFNVVDSSWIEYLIQHFEKPHVGAVEFKLTYPESTIDHEGFDHTLGVPYPLKRWFRANEAGYFYSACGVQNISPIAGEYFATPANIFRKIGGFTIGLSCNYFISDYYQKLTKHGLVALYEPNAELIVLEDTKKTFQIDIENLDIYRLGWKASPNSEPFYSACK